MAIALAKPPASRKHLAPNASLGRFQSKNLAHGGPFGHAPAVLAQRRELARVDPVAGQPAEQGEEVGVADREGPAQDPGPWNIASSISRKQAISFSGTLRVMSAKELSASAQR